MAGIFQADIDLLNKTVQSLRGSEQVLTDVMKAMSKDGNADIGTTTLNESADNFQRRWEYGIERICESAKVTADGVAQCSTAYQDLDKSTALLIAMTGTQIAPQASVPGVNGQ
ncbi:hypothetical protein ACFWUP_06735 [Nocardia sp. NPDC058658]|uniref:hypothetical protein n=1 Tax=Nocardia sp. NPDC058658 TaxID=3346580 RepID=UPI00365F118D